MKITTIESNSAPRTFGSYSQAMLVEQARRLLFVSGQIPETAEGQVPKGFESQCKLAWRNVLAQLEAAELSVSNLVKINIFLSSREHTEANSRIRQEVLGEHRPALTIIIADIFDEEWLLEIEAVAAAA